MGCCKKLKVFIIGTLLLAFQQGFAADTAQSKTAELSKLNQLIKGLRDALTSDQSQKTAVDQQLQQTEKNIQQVSSRLNAINKDIVKQAAILQTLQKKQQLSEQEIKQQQAILADQIRHTYQLGRNQQAQTIFEQPANDVSRMLMYYRYINDARLATMQSLNQSLQQVLANQQQLKRQKQALQPVLAQYQQQKDALKNAQQNKKILLTQLNTKIQTHNQRLSQLIANKQALEKLIKQLQMTQQAQFPQGSTPLANLQGKLPWPTNGRVVKRYGTQIDTSGLRYNGVLLSAPKGQPVQAIYPGKVVFANWLQGFGNVIIIDHGKGYMTLYGRNNELNKKTGDFVKAGDVIASVGNNSGQEQTGLYFEIRHNGRPSNPETWCRAGAKKP